MMTSLVMKTILILALASGLAAVAYQPAMTFWNSRNQVTWRTKPVVHGSLTRFVNSTGTVRPVLSVSVGSFVSGPIVELNVDFNDEVAKGQLLAKIDPQTFEAIVQRDEATLAARDAELEHIEVQLEHALSDYQRGQRLREKNAISSREIDDLFFQVKSLRAQRKLAEASVLQAKATLENSRANLNYTDIKSPVDGLVIDRKIDPGQTLAAQFQTPELFVVAPDLRKKIHVFASVDEADIGLIQAAKEQKRPVTFTVDAHPEKLFHGSVEEIRINSSSTQNVVTYPVVIAAENPDLALLPGMTANISFEVDSREDAIKIPNAALRFYPEDLTRVREADRELLDGSLWKRHTGDEESQLSAGEAAIARIEQSGRHVWVRHGQFLKAVEVKVGISDNRYTELVSGEVEAGDLLVTGVESS